jgi:hypothetical protein
MTGKNLIIEFYLPLLKLNSAILKVAADTRRMPLITPTPAIPHRGGGRKIQQFGAAPDPIDAVNLKIAQFI